MLAILAVLAPVLLGPLFTTPQLNAVGVVVQGPSAILSGLVGAFAVTLLLKEPVTVLPWVGPRDIRIWRMLRVALLMASIVVAMVLLGGGQASGPVLVCLLSLSGEALLAAAVLWEEIAWALPVIHAGMTLTFGTDVFGTPLSWAWILQREPTMGHVAFSTVLFAIGLLTWARRRPRVH
ncbi:hypothetical protein [Serinicoccus hydrothermalis]|uniref:hypothetical protein n=1 Tax=Serinicoccus hydrothermalis TaxID=1758689 RepID=UPI0012F73203|nr:hypothetical protein [Serinicoccus hydrothermalis]